MGDIREITLGEVCLKITDGAHHSPKEVKGGKPMFSVKNMSDHGFDYNGVKTISEEDFNNLVNLGCQPEVDDILIAKDGSVMKHVFRAKGNIDYVLLSSIAIVRPNKAIVNSAFLVYAIKNPSTTDLILNNFVGGSGVPRIVLKDFRKVGFRIPNLKTQTEIAEVLSSLDDKIDLLHRQNKTLESMAEALFRQWFVEEAKEEWEVSKLGRYISTNQKSIDKNYLHSHIYYLDTGSINSGKWGTLQYVNLSDAPSRARRLVEHNDIIYSTVRPNQLHYGIVRNPIDNLVVSTGFCVVNCHSISPYFVYYLITDEDMTERLHSIAEGSTSAYPSLRPKDIEDIFFRLPPQNTIQEFHMSVDTFWSKIEYNQKQILNLEMLRDSLLPKLMSGEVQVKL
jgi:type I restriction enzyme S subunit